MRGKQAKRIRRAANQLGEGDATKGEREYLIREHHRTYVIDKVVDGETKKVEQRIVKLELKTTGARKIYRVLKGIFKSSNRHERTTLARAWS